MQQDSTDYQAFEDMIHEGLEASRAGNMDRALEKFRDSMVIFPSSGLPHFLSGAELAQGGLLEEAEAAFSAAILLSPTLKMARFQLGLLQYTSGRVNVALLTWAPLADAADTDPVKQFVHGFTALAVDDFEAALAFFRQGIAFNQENPPLSRDMQLVVDRIIQKISPEAASKSPGSDAATANSETDEHVLLANYRPRGTPH